MLDSKAIVFKKKHTYTKNCDSAENENNIEKNIADIVLTVLLSIGITGIISSTFGYENIHFMDVLMAVVMVAPFMVLFEIMPLKGRIAIASLYMCFITAFAFIWKEEVINGARVFFEDISETLESTYGKIFPSFIFKENESIVCVFTVLAIVTIFILSQIIVAYENMAALYALVICSILLVVSCSTTVQFVFFGIITCVVFLVSKKKKTVRDGENINVLFLKRLMIISFSGIALIIVSSCLTDYFADSVTKINTYITKKSDEARYQQKEDNSHTALEVKMTRPQSYYLKGFVGEEFSLSGWQEKAENTEITKEKRKRAAYYSNVFFWLHEKDFYGQKQFSNALKSFELKDEEENVIQIKNISASTKYIYAPYELSFWNIENNDRRDIGDSNIYAGGTKGKREYTLKASDNMMPLYGNILGKINENVDESQKEYLLEENYYSSYIYDSYTYLDEETKEILKNHMGEIKTQKNHAPYVDVKNNILECLNKNINYTENATLPVSNNFIQNFLEIKGSGDDRWYATAAVMMFRYYNIPARYVEGYIITPRQTEGVKKNETIYIPETNRHAWAEYYRDGVGFVPFECVPKYMDLMLKDQDAKGGYKTESVQKNIDKQEIVKDNYENNENKKDDKNKDKIQFTKVVLFIVIIVLLVFILYHFAALLKKRITIRKKIKSDDNNIAIMAMFTYVIDMLIRRKICKKNMSVSYYEKQIQKLSMEEEKDNYQSAVRIYEKARYSNAQCTAAERKIMESFMENIRK